MKDWDYENDQWTRLPPHLKHLPLFTRDYDLMSLCFRFGWSLFLKTFFNTWVRTKVIGNFREVYKKHPRLLIISNHSSHLDATSVAAVIPFRFWGSLYIAAAKDYFFSNRLFTFFSAHCLGAIPIDRKDRKGEAITLCVTLLKKLDRIWLIIFPEGTRSPDGKLQTFKKGISVFAERTDTPILFLYIHGNADIWPKGRHFAKFGKSLEIHIGPVHPPAPIEEVQAAYKEWVAKINPKILPPENAE